MADDFAIVPEKEMSELKAQMDSIRRNPLGPYGGQDLIESMNNLTRAINSLMQLFQTAAEELKLEERETETITRKIDPMLARIEAISDQNRKIAQGVVAVADMLESARLEGRAPIPQPKPPEQMPSFAPQMRTMPSPESPFAPAQMGPQQLSGLPTNLPPPPAGPRPLAGIRLPPIPPPKKKGLFG